MGHKAFWALPCLVGSILLSQSAGPLIPRSITRNEKSIIVYEHGDKIYKIDKNFKNVESMPLPNPCFNLFTAKIFMCGGKIGISTIEWVADGRREWTVNRFFEWVDKKWNLVFELSSSQEHGGYGFVFPLLNGDFLAIHRHPFKMKNDDESIFCILRKNPKGEWVRHRTVDSDIPPRAFRFKGLPRRFQVAQVGECLAVADPHPGYIWLFHQEDGRLKRRVKLYDDLDLQRLEKNDFSSAMLGIQPAEDGTFLIAARPEATVLNDDFAQRLRSGHQGLEGYSEIQVGGDAPALLADYAWKHHPEVVWKSLDPETGSLKTLNPPPKGAKAEIHTWFEAQSFHWIPTWDGEVVVGDLERAIEAARQREAKAEAARKGPTKGERRAQTEPIPEKAGAKP